MPEIVALPTSFRIRFYLDKLVPPAVATGLYRRGVDALTTQDAGQAGASDKEQLEFAIKERRTIFTMDEDLKKGQLELLRRATAGDTEAQCLLSQSCSSSKLRQKWLWTACRGGHLRAYQELHGSPLFEVHSRAEEGFADAQTALGIYYATLATPELERSRHWYMQAALQGDAQAMYEIGFLLLLGEGGPAEPRQAVEWLEKTAMRPPWAAEARRLLGDVLEGGLYGVPRDPVRSQYWRSLPSMDFEE